jgi:hypothetical protein
MQEVHHFGGTYRHPLFLGQILPSGQKPTLGLLVNITLEVALFGAYALFPVLLPCYKCTPEVVIFDWGNVEK